MAPVHPAPMDMWDATVKVTVRHDKAKDHAANQGKVRAKGADRAVTVARKDKRVKAQGGIARRVKITALVQSLRTMISSPAPTRTWARKAA